MKYQQPVINTVVLAKDAVQSGGTKSNYHCYDGSGATQGHYTNGAYDVDE